MKKPVLIIFLFIIFLILLFFLIRMFSPREIDDVSPEIPCSQKYLNKADVLWVIPKFNGKPISENKSWCKYVLSLNKTIGLHGVYHIYDEFGVNRSQKYLSEGIKIFIDCFGFKPTMFKPPQLKINNKNKKLMQKNNLKLKGKFNQFIHKVYHCNDTGKFSNWFIDLI